MFLAMNSAVVNITKEFNREIFKVILFSECFVNVRGSRNIPPIRRDFDW